MQETGDQAKVGLVQVGLLHIICQQMFKHGQTANSHLPLIGDAQHKNCLLLR